MIKSREKLYSLLVLSKPDQWEALFVGSLKEVQDYSNAFRAEGYREGYYDTITAPATKIENGRATEYPGFGETYAQEMESLGFVYTETGGGCDGYMLADGNDCVLVTRYDGGENCRAPSNYNQDCVVWYDNETCFEHDMDFEVFTVYQASPQYLLKEAKKLLENLKTSD